MQLRRASAGDLGAVVRLHQASFGGEPRTEAYWRWMFARGLRLVLACAEDAEPIGCFGGVPHRLWRGGRVAAAMLDSDVAVRPDWRRGLASGRLLVAMGRERARDYDGCDFVWGFPQPGLDRVGVDRLGFEMVGEVFYLARPVAPAAGGRLPVRALSSVDGRIDELWQHCAPELGTAVVRDARHWQERFVDHPSVRYTLLAVEGGDGVRAVAAVRCGGLYENVVSVVDWLAPAADAEAESSLLAAIDDFAREHARSHVMAWFSPYAQQFLSWQHRHGFRCGPTPYRQMVRRFATGLGLRSLQEQWYRTLADMDFV